MLHALLEPSSPRARYIVRHVFERMLGWPVTFVGTREELLQATGPRLIYGPQPLEGAFHLVSNGWLDRKAVVMDPDHLPSPADEGFDLFAAAFFCLARVEEYALRDRDAHGRIPSLSLWGARSGADHRPFVDEWALALADRLRQPWPALPAPRRTFSHLLTVDMDSGLKYAARPWHRAWGASLKELLRGDLAGLRQRWRTRAGAADPYTRCVDALRTARTGVDRLIAFVLTRGNGRYDHAADIGHPAYRALLTGLSPFAEIGLHPSYESSRNETLIAEERDRLRDTLGRPVRLSRQHFLRWTLPGTFRALISAGIAEDHSMGYSDRIGFRAGTCTPFPWYDLERDEETSLLIVPFAVMDSALREKKGMQLDEALRSMMDGCDAVRRVGGTFVSVWHDRYLSGHGEFAGGPEAMMRLVQHARP